MSSCTNFAIAGTGFSRQSKAVSENTYSSGSIYIPTLLGKSGWPLNLVEYRHILYKYIVYT